MNMQQLREHLTADNCEIVNRLSLILQAHVLLFLYLGLTRLLFSGPHMGISFAASSILLALENLEKEVGRKLSVVYPS
jgi:hypothetical protein